jgi:exopolysaccharide biosynthesis predicted pyruvyltransferase EpsI
MKLKDVFNENRGRRFIFVRPGGNFGDQLIYAGAEKLANDLKLQYRTCFLGYNVDVSEEFNTRALMNEVRSGIDPSDIIYMHGGGAFNSMWTSGNKLLKILYSTFPNMIIVGPSSCTIETKYLRHFLSNDKRIIFFARELITYEFMKKSLPNVYIDDDTALHLTKDCTEFKSFCMGVPLKKNHKLLVIRQDKERALLPKTIRKEDFDFVCDPKSLKKDEWLKLHLWASEITSNRLHSAIFGTIAEKDVGLFSNSYHKNRSVWEYSLQKLGVKWIPHSTAMRYLYSLKDWAQRTPLRQPVETISNRRLQDRFFNWH